MDIRELSITGAYEITTTQFADERGVFLEWFKAQTFAQAVGRSLDLGQANVSVSNRGVLRGIHYADVPPSQAKYVTCMYGAVLDVVVDIRLGSPTFGLWDSVLLDDVDRKAIFISEGLGHAFLSLRDGSTVAYACSQPWSPGHEHEINPLDPAIGIDWPLDVPPILSAKDAAAPSLRQAADAGLLPSYDACQTFIASLS